MANDVTHDTTPAVGDVWERDGIPVTVSYVDAQYVTGRFGDGCKLLWTIDEWHAWAANARRVG